jgi:DNA ligase-1
MDIKKMQTQKTLQAVKNFSNDLRATTSSNDKKEIIKTYSKNHWLTDILVYTYSPYIHFGVSSKNCKKLSHLRTTNNTITLVKLLESLADKTYTGHTAISMVNGFVANHKEYEGVIYNILDKDLKTRAGASLINKAIPGLIPQFKVALAEAIDVLPDFETEEWLGSRKLDGVRCIIRKEQDEISAHSRAGNEFETLQLVLDDVLNIPGDFILDGEICIVDDNGSEHFQDVMKEIRRKDHTIKNPKFFIFDYLTLEEFDTQVGTTKLEDRYTNLQGCDLESTNTLTLLEQYPLESEIQFTEMVKEAEEHGYEGIMVRRNTGYKGKRSKDILKVKKFHDAEYEVVSCDFENHRIIREGQEVLMPMLAQVYITHKGNEVAVGSGFSQEQRIKYEANPELIIGKTITVQYFEESQNKEGLYSLRFPVIKHIYESTRDC